MTMFDDNDTWNVWSDWGVGATVSIAAGVLRIVDLSGTTNGSKYLKFGAKGGDKIRFDIQARAEAGQGTFWINLVAIGSVIAAESIVSNAEFEHRTLEFVVPHTYAAVDVFVGFGVTAQQVGTVEGFAPDVYVNGRHYNPSSNIVQSGNLVGVGIWNPSYKFHIGGGGNPSSATDYFEAGPGGSAHIFRRGRGTAASPAALQSGDYIGSILASGYNGSSWSGNSGLAGFMAAENFSSTAYGTSFVVGITPAGTTARVERLRLDGTNGALRAGTDNAQALGASSYRWSVVYAGSGSINTSDAREKQQVRPISDAERAVASRIKNLIRAFRFNDAVEVKGDSARIHFGVVAQEVIAAFEAEGLDAMRYAMICFDEWRETPEIVEQWEDEFDENGVLVRPAGHALVQAYRAAGNLYGVRYDQLLAFVIAAL